MTQFEALIEQSALLGIVTLRLFREMIQSDFPISFSNEVVKNHQLGNALRFQARFKMPFWEAVCRSTRIIEWRKRLLQFWGANMSVIF